MRLRKEMIDYLARSIVYGLEGKELIDTAADTDEVVESVAGIITRDLQIEDGLNDEVKVILDDMGDEIDKANINYRKMFQMVKQKLAKERGLIL